MLIECPNCSEKHIVPNSMLKSMDVMDRLCDKCNEDAEDERYMAESKELDACLRVVEMKLISQSAWQ